MSGISKSDIEAQFALLVRLAMLHRTGIIESWELVPGDETSDGREPWTVEDGSRVSVLRLGYTRREALTALVHMNAVLTAITELPNGADE